MISVTGLSKKFGNTVALKNVSFSVSQGEILGFLGPNGAGKTTTIRILTGYLTPTEGKVTIAGIDIQQKPLHARKHIGYLPENVPIYNELTVTEYLRFVAGIKSVPSKERQAHLSQIVENCGLTSVVNKLTGNLSKGYRQRLGLAQALIGNPDILILDEPTTGLDPRQIIEIRELIRKLRGERTIILSSHILPEVSNLCDRVIIMNQGSIVAKDTPENLEKHIGNKQIVRLEVEADMSTSDVIHSLKQIQGIDHISADSSSIPTRHLLIIQAQSDVEFRPLLAKHVVDAGMKLYELRREAKTLEEIFMKLVTDQKVTR